MRFSAVAVFCGSRMGADPAYRRAADQLGRLLAESGVRLVYGGGGIGLMEVVAEAVLAHGGRVTGVIPEFLVKYEVGKRDITEMVVVASMHERKTRMFDLAEACIVLPGGLGTLDETIEIITWKQLRLHAKPIVLVDVADYWAPLTALVDRVIAGGFAHPRVRELFAVVGRVDEVFAALESAPEPSPEVLTGHL